MSSSSSTPDVNTLNVSKTSSSSIQELTESFQKLLVNASGDMEALKSFEVLLSNEIDRVSNHGSDQEEELPGSNENPGWLLSDLESPPFSVFEGTPFDNFKVNLLDESTSYDKIFSNWTVAYYGEHPYRYSGAHHNPRPISDNVYLSEIAAKVSNLFPEVSFNSAMVTKYDHASSHIPFHSDITTEKSIVPGSCILTISLGQTRKVEFRKKPPFSPDTSSLDAVHGIAYTMTQASQNIYEHAVQKLRQEEFKGPRISVTFRQLITPLQSTTPPPLQNTTAPLASLSNGFLVHSSREPLVTHTVPQKDQGVEHKPLIKPKHLIIGDSMARGLKVPDNCAIICKGGIRPDQVLQLLPGSMDILHPDIYDDIETVTLVAGTNALNIYKPGKGMPLLDVIEDYEKLIYDIKKLFPNAKLGLFNVLPRVYTCTETCRRIEIFNTIFELTSKRLQNVVWIHLYSEFLDNLGYLRRDLYGVRGIHLKPKGKALMVKSIRKFQSMCK